MTQVELANLVGYPTVAAVSRQERSINLPPLIVALAYEALFRAPITELFPGLNEAVRQVVENRLASLEKRFKNEPTRRAELARVAQVLTWIESRRAMAYPIRES